MNKRSGRAVIRWVTHEPLPSRPHLLYGYLHASVISGVIIGESTTEEISTVFERNMSRRVPSGRERIAAARPDAVFTV